MTASAAGPRPVYLVRGDDTVLVGDAVRELVNGVVGDDDPAFVVQDLADEDLDVAGIVDAAQTPPFLGDRRVVVVRQVGRFSAEQAAPLVDYLDDPLPTTTVVLVGGGGQVAKRLVDKVKERGQLVSADAPTGRARTQWIADHLKRSDVRLDADATARVSEHLGEDAARLDRLLDSLSAAYGSGSRLSVDEVEPFLGEAGAAAPWVLTDAIDAGDAARALEHLGRMLGRGGRHPLELLAVLHGHYRRMLRLDGAEVADEKEAAAALGLTGSTFPAKKALAQSRRLGQAGVARAITLLADADIAIKGELDWPPELILEVLVARLSRLAPRAKAAAR